MVAYFESIIEQCRNPVVLVAQILGFLPVILGFLIFADRSRKSSILMKGFADFSAAVHFALLSQWTGCGICLVNTVRDVCFAQREKVKWLSGKFVPVIFCVLTVIASMLSWTGPESILPMLGSCFALVGYWCLNTHHMRLFNLAGVSLWFVYGLVTYSVSTWITNGAYIISILRTELSLLYRNRQNSKTGEEIDA